jgi:hypothetical protein
VVERLTRVSGTAIRAEATIEDPNVPEFLRVAFPLNKD